MGSTRRPRRFLRWVRVAGFLGPTFVAVVLCFALASSVSPARAGDDGVEAARYAQLIDDLGSSDFTLRQAAEEALVAAGMSAAPVLTRAAEDDDLEIRTRARRLLRRVEELRLQQIPEGWKEAWSVPRKASASLVVQDPWESSGVVLAEDDRKYVAFDLETGKKLWESAANAAQQVAQIPLVQTTEGGFVFFKHPNQAEFRDARSGETRWTTELQFSPHQWFVRSDLLVIGDVRRLAAVSLVDGEFVYVRESPKQYAPIGADDERIAMWSNAERKISIRRLTDGEPIGEWAPAQPANAVVRMDGERIVFLEASRQFLSAYRTSDGLSLWTSPLDPSRAPFQTFFPTWFDADDRHLAAPGLLWSLETGKKVFDRKPAGPKIHSLRLADQLPAGVRCYPAPPTVAGDVVYFPGLDGRLQACRIDGAPLWTWQVGPGAGFRVIAHEDRLIASTDQRLVCLVRTGSTEPQAAADEAVIVAEKREAERP